MRNQPAPREWLIRSPRYGFEWTGPLVALWEVYGDPISDDFTTNEASAAELFQRWVDGLDRRKHQDLLPITWYIDSPGHAKFEAAPFQHPGCYEGEDFLTFYDWPVDPRTGGRINWFRDVPVRDKLWHPGRGDKGGFIQEHTGWKPAMLQPYVSLLSLRSGVP